MISPGFDSITNSWWPIIISFFISIVGAIRVFAAGPKCPNNTRIDGKVVLITGASSGIGFEVAKELAIRGAKVILTCRNLEKGFIALEAIKKCTSNPLISVEQLDVSKLSDIKRFVQDFKQKHKKLNILINNAGIIFSQYEKTEENFEISFVTNYLGPFFLTHSLLPFLKREDGSRIINISANAHFGATMDLNNLNFCNEFLYREAFGQTKLALTMFSIYFADVLKKTNNKITMNAVNPGIVRGTNHLNKSPLNSSWMTRVSVFPWTWLFLKSPKQGAQTIIYAAVERSLEHVTGKYLSDCEIKEPSEVTKDVRKMRELYEKSCLLCEIDPYDNLCNKNK